MTHRGPFQPPPFCDSVKRWVPVVWPEMALRHASVICLSGCCCFGQGKHPACLPPPPLWSSKLQEQVPLFQQGQGNGFCFIVLPPPAAAIMNRPYSYDCVIPFPISPRSFLPSLDLTFSASVPSCPRLLFPGWSQFYWIHTHTWCF